MADDLNINIGANPAGVEAGSRRAKSALQGVAAGGRDLDAALRRLRTAIDPTFAAMERFNKTKQDNLALMRAGAITRKEYNAGMKAAKAALDAETAAIERNTAAGRAKIEADKAARQQALQAARAAKEEETRLAREAAAAKRQAERQAMEESRRLKREEREAAKAAAAEAKRLAQEVRQAEVQARRQAAEALKAAKAEERRLDREAKQAEAQARRQAVEEEREARRQQRAEAKATAEAVKQAARERREAERSAAAEARNAAAAAADLARAERQQAQAVQELRSSIDPAYAAQQRYNETMRRATQLLMQNKLQQGEWNAIQHQARTQMDLNVRSLGAQNAMYVQLGYQAQDVTASLASGINPLVILAQQGGQTAAALSGLGGTAGRVAAFFAGPWGAAIIGATLLIGYLWDSYNQGEKATKDLMNAEDRRKMTVKELTEAVKEYTAAQRQANETTRQGAINEAYSTTQARARIIAEMSKAQDRLTAAQERYNLAVKAATLTPNPLTASAVAAARTELFLAERQVENLKDSYKAANEAAMEAGAAYAQTMADMSELEKREQDELTAALGVYRREYAAAGADAQKQTAAIISYQQRLAQIQEHYNKLKEQEREARKENAKTAREEQRATFQSREQAIGIAGRELQKQGYRISENTQFGGVKSNHPGMGNKAHGAFAIDINVGKSVTEADDSVIRARMDKMVRAYQARGFRILWNGKVYEPGPQGAVYDIKPGANQHRDHAHMEAPKSIVGQSAGSSLGTQLVNEADAQAREMEQMLEQAHRAKMAYLEFEQELNREDLQMVLDLQDQKIAAIKEFYGEASEEAADAMRERVRIERAQSRELRDIQRRDIDFRLNLAQQAAQTEADLVAMRQDAQAEALSFAEGSGVLDPRAAVAQKAALLDQEYANQVAHENRMFSLKMEALRASLNIPGLELRQIEELNRSIEATTAEHLNRMTLMQAEYGKNIQGIQREAASVSMRQWQDVGSTLSQSLGSTFQGIWTHTQTLHQAFIQMADQMVYKFVDMGLQMFQNWFMQQVGMTAVQQAQETARTGLVVAGQAAQSGAVVAGQTAQVGAKVAAATTEQGIIAATTGAKLASEAIKTSAAVTGAAAQTGAAATAGMTEVTTNAAVAAAGAYKSTVVIPFIGPIAAPAAAALALAAVLGFGALISARGGQGEVPFDGQLSMLHKKEMVLPAQFAVPLRQMLVSPRSSGGMMASAASAGSSARMGANSNNANFYYQPQHTNTNASMSDLLRRDSRELRRWIRNEVRNGGLKLS